MITAAILLATALLAGAGHAAPDLGALSVGLVDFVPALDEVREDLVRNGHGELIDDEGRSTFLSLLAPIPERKESWVNVFYTRYRGESGDTEVEIDVHDLGAAYFAMLHAEKTLPFFGVGANAFHIRRHEELTSLSDFTHKDWQWGLHAQAGFCYVPLKWTRTPERRVTAPRVPQIVDQSPTPTSVLRRISKAKCLGTRGCNRVRIGSR